MIAATYMIFSATLCCAHSGILLMSMLLPQVAALLLFAVCMSVAAPIAAKAEFCRVTVRKKKTVTITE